MSSAASPSQVSQPAWQAPDPAECDEDVFNWLIAAGEMIYQRIMTNQDDRIVEFAVMQMTQVGGHYVQVARVDSEHGTIHAHQLFKATPDDTVGQRREMFVISSVDDVALGLDAGIEFLTENWEENKRRWRDGR
jgi:hypothetical protein